MAKTIADTLRRAVTKAERAGTSRYRVAKDAGIAYSQLLRFMEGENLPRLDKAEQIASAIGMRLTLCAK